jgi:hypothetical protein
MLLIDYQKLDMTALGNPNHPMCVYAEEYDKGIRELRQMYPEGTITLKRVGYPILIDGITGSGKEVRGIPEPISPMRISFKAKFEHPKRGKELWAVCQGLPKPLQGGLWDIGDKKGTIIEDKLVIDLINDADLAFFMYYRSPLVLKGHLKVDDPAGEIRAKGKKEREALERKTAIWQTLADDAQLRKVAMGYGISDAMKKEPDAIRFELEELLTANDKRRESEPGIKGTKDFLEDMKITNYMRLSAFIQDRIDNAVIVWKPDGKYKVGDKIIALVPANEAKNKKEWLVNYFSAQNNSDKLKELLTDTVDRTYLESVIDPKDFRWLAECMKIEGYFNKPPEQVKEMVFAEFAV